MSARSNTANVEVVAGVVVSVVAVMVALMVAVVLLVVAVTVVEGSVVAVDDVVVVRVVVVRVVADAVVVVSELVSVVVVLLTVVVVDVAVVSVVRVLVVEVVMVVVDDVAVLVVEVVMVVVDDVAVMVVAVVVVAVNDVLVVRVVSVIVSVLVSVLVVSVKVVVVAVVAVDVVCVKVFVAVAVALDDVVVVRVVSVTVVVVPVLVSVIVVPVVVVAVNVDVVNVVCVMVVVVQPAADLPLEQDVPQIDGGNCSAEEDPMARDAKRPRLLAPTCSIEMADARLTATAEEVRTGLLEEDGRLSHISQEEAAQTKSLQEACNRASRQLEVAAAQCNVERAALISAKAKLRACQADREKTAQTEKKLGPLVEGFERVSQEVSETCQATTTAAMAAAGKDSVPDLAETLSCLAESGIDSALKRLDSTTTQLNSMTEERIRTEGTCKAAEDRLASLLQALEEEEQKRKATEKAQAVDAKTAQVTKEVTALEEEVTAVEAVMNNPKPSPEAKAEADGSATSTGTGCLAFLKKRLDELQLACEKQGTSISSLEARCGPLQPDSTPQQEQAVPVAQEGAGTKHAKDLPTVLDMVNPAPFVTARAAQRLFVSSEDAPEVAGEYRQAAGGLNGWPAYKASGATVFLFWTPCEGGRWVFGPDLSNESQVLARSLQLAWTALPDEVMAISWTRAPWGERGQRACIAVLRG